MHLSFLYALMYSLCINAFILLMYLLNLFIYYSLALISYFFFLALISHFEQHVFYALSQSQSEIK